MCVCVCVCVCAHVHTDPYIHFEGGVSGSGDNSGYQFMLEPAA